MIFFLVSKNPHFATFPETEYKNTKNKTSEQEMCLKRLLNTHHGTASYIEQKENTRLIAHSNNLRTVRVDSNN